MAALRVKANALAALQFAQQTSVGIVSYRTQRTISVVANQECFEQLAFQVVEFVRLGNTPTSPCKLHARIAVRELGQRTTVTIH